MLMKVFNKGQVVIPAEIRRNLGISVGDLLDVVIDAKNKTLQMKPQSASQAQKLAGSLSSYSHKGKNPTRQDMANVLKKGFAQ